MCILQQIKSSDRRATWSDRRAISAAPPLCEEAPSMSLGLLRKTARAEISAAAAAAHSSAPGTPLCSRSIRRNCGCPSSTSTLHVASSPCATASDACPAILSLQSVSPPTASSLPPGSLSLAFGSKQDPGECDTRRPSTFAGCRCSPRAPAAVPPSPGRRTRAPPWRRR